MIVTIAPYLPMQVSILAADGDTALIEAPGVVIAGS